MDFILGLLAVSAVILSLVLTVVILLQEPKGGGLAAALGGSGMEAIGVNTGSVNRFTMTVAGIWIVICLFHAILMSPPVVIADGGGEDTPVDTGGNGTPGDGGDTGVDKDK